jgi:hypothetical protein
VAQPLDRAFLPAAIADLRRLAEIAESLVDLAFQTVTDLAQHRKKGKALGDRRVTGDLTGCHRTRFDLPGERTERFRVVYRLVPPERPHTIEVIAIGPRGGHAAYDAAVSRLTPDS